jgi:hypothetical protein
MSTPTGLDDPEDAKLVTLSRATRQRTDAADGAAVRDLDGRTYTAATVDLPSLRLPALALAVAMAVSSGAKGLEAAAVVTHRSGPGQDELGPDELGPDELGPVRDLAGAGIPVFVADPSGSLSRVVRT